VAERLAKDFLIVGDRQMVAVMIAVDVADGGLDGAKGS